MQHLTANLARLLSRVFHKQHHARADESAHPSLTNYLKDVQLEIDNNKIENLIRPLALGRKNFLFMGSSQGAKAGAIFYSLIATCTANGIEPYKYFCTMLHQIRHYKTEDNYRKLLPQFIQF